MLKFRQISPTQLSPYVKMAGDYGRKLYEQIRLASGISKPGTKASGPLPIIACDFGHSKITLAEVEKSNSGLRLVRFHKGLKTDAAATSAAVLKQLFAEGKFSHSRVRISVKGQGVVMRFIQFPQMKLEDVRSALSFEAEKYIPFKSADVVMDYHVLDENVTQGAGAFINLLLVAVRRDELYPVIQTFKDAGLEIEFVDVDALASLNALEYFHPEEWKSSVGFIDFGAEITSLCVIREGKPRFIRDISFGGMDFIKRLKRKLGVSEEKAREYFLETRRKPTPEIAVIIQESVGNLVADLKVSLNYYLDQIPNAQAIKKLFIAGIEAYHPLVVETLSKELGIPVEPMNIFEKLICGPEVNVELVKENLGFLPVPLGLCLREK